MLRPSRDDFRALAREHTVVPVWREVLADLRQEAKQYISPYAFAIVLTALGEKTPAIDELGRGYDDGGFYISLIKVDPLFDDLRGDPRFEALVQKITRGK